MRRLCCVVFLCLPLLALAQQSMELIPLKHRTMEQVLPVLQSLLEPGDSLSGMNDQLILRASPTTRAQVKQALAAIDTPVRSLLIHVTQNRDDAMSRSGAQAYGKIETETTRISPPPAGAAQSGTRIEVRSGDSVIGAQAVNSQKSGTTRGQQSVRVIEGGRAFINVGQSVPLPMRQVVQGPGGTTVTETVVYRDSGQGFYAEPRLSGERVTLEISPQYDTPGHQVYGSVNTQRVSTTVSGRLGEWIEIGGANQQFSSQKSGNLSTGSREGYDNRSVWLMVEEVR